MQSRNPVFNRAEGFNGRRATSAVASDPSQWHVDPSQRTSIPGLSSNDRMSIDNVVEKTGLTLGLVVLTAAVTWFMIGDVQFSQAAAGTAYLLAMGGALIGFVLSMVNSFKKVISPGLVLAYAAVEGVFVGAFSKIMVAFTGGEPIIVFQAVMATMFAFGTTLAAYKFFNIQVTDKFRKVVMISMFAFVGVMLLNFVLSMFGVLPNGGLRDPNNIPLTLLVSGIAIVLAVFMLIMDFDFVERGIEAGLPERESWRAAFGLTVTLIWMYIEFLRLLAILRGND